MLPLRPGSIPNSLKEYYVSTKKNDSVSLAEYHRVYFNLAPDEAIAFNKDQRIVIVGQTITPK